MSIDSKSAGQPLSQGFGQLDTFRLAALDETRDFQVALRSSLQQEALRIEAKYGPDHPRSRRLAARLETNLAAVEALEVEREIARITVPEVGKGEALVHGRIVDSRSRGLAGLIACLVDGQSQPIPELPSSTSDPSGYYALPLGDAALQVLGGYSPFLGVFGSDGKIVYQGKESLTIKPDVRLVMEVALTLSPPTSPGDPVEQPRESAASTTAEAGLAKPKTKTKTTAKRTASPRKKPAPRKGKK